MKAHIFNVNELQLGSIIRINDSSRDGSMVQMTPTMMEILLSDPGKFSEIYQPMLMTEQLIEKIRRRTPWGDRREFFKRSVSRHGQKMEHWWSNDIGEWSKLEMDHAMCSDFGYHIWLNNTFDQSSFVPIIGYDKFRYFHQLQTLYVALIGADLVIDQSGDRDAEQQEK